MNHAIKQAHCHRLPQGLVWQHATCMSQVAGVQLGALRITCSPCCWCAGAHEGAFAWLTLNYLLGKLGRDAAATVAAIDLGGGSVQEAFALTDEQVGCLCLFSLSVQGIWQVLHCT